MEVRMKKKHARALVSVHNKDALSEIIPSLAEVDIELVSTGGTASYIREMGFPVTDVEHLTSYPSLLGGRVKTLHPAIFGGILCRPANDADHDDLNKFGISPIDVVVVDLYPFHDMVARGASLDEVIENIDIGGISLIRAAAKNFENVLVVPSAGCFSDVSLRLTEFGGETTLSYRRRMAAMAMHVSSHYDTAIFHYLDEGDHNFFKESLEDSFPLRYGENPHQQAVYYGNLDVFFEKLGGKSLSYNNLLDVDAAMALIREFVTPAFAIVKHTNACGVATRDTIEEAWEKALAADPVSAFGGILISNRHITTELAESIREVFFEVLIAPSYDEKGMEVLTSNKNRIILRSKPGLFPDHRYRSLFDGVLLQSQDHKTTSPGQWRQVTSHGIKDPVLENDLVLANTVVKHLKSNAIALVKNNMLLGIGCGQTSRVDALKQAIQKARQFDHDLEGAVMASDAFFPFPDCVEIADKAGIKAVIQPGGSKRDQDSITYCNKAGIAMVFTGNRHFRH